MKSMPRLGILLALALTLGGLVATPAAHAAKPKVSLTASSVKVAVGSTVTLRASVTKGATGQKASLQIKKGKKWKTLSTKTLAGWSTKTVSFSTKVKKSSSYRVSLKKKGKAKAAKSRVIKINASKPKTGKSVKSAYATGTTFRLHSWNLRFGKANSSTTGAPAQWSHVTVPVTFGHISGAAIQPWIPTRLSYLGNDGRAYTTDVYPKCLPASNSHFNIPALAAGASGTGNVCIAVPTKAVLGGHWRVKTDNKPDYRYIKASF